MSMPTFVRDPIPIELQQLIDRRRRLGLDRFDEVWEGVLHMNPVPAGRHGNIVMQLGHLLSERAKRGRLTLVGEFNIGDDLHDFRAPDGGLLRDFTSQVFYPTAALVIEVVSPGDDSWNKLGFYANRGVDEVVIVDPDTHTVHWLARAGDSSYEPVESSAVIELGPAELAAAIDWP